MFSTDYESNTYNEKASLITSPTELVSPPQESTADFLVPANLQFANAITGQQIPPLGFGTSGTPPPPKKKAAVRAHHHISPSTEMDQYFEEGEKKSREVDYAPSVKTAAGIPPPPKIGSLAPPPKSGPPPKDRTPSPLGQE
jgi:hypothetical protein